MQIVTIIGKNVENMQRTMQKRTPTKLSKKMMWLWNLGVFDGFYYIKKTT